MKIGKIANVRLMVAMLTLMMFPLAHAAVIQTNQHVDEIVAQQQVIRADVKAVKNGWDEIPEQKRNELLGKQDRLMVLLAGKGTIGDLNETDQVEVANTLEWIKALATNAEGERQICQRERQTGSHRVTTVCRSVESMRKERERTKDTMQFAEHLSRTPPPSAGAN